MMFSIQLLIVLSATVGGETPSQNQSQESMNKSVNVVVQQSDPVVLPIDEEETLIPLIKCCQDDRLYRPGLDLCRHGVGNARQVASLPVYNSDDSSLTPSFIKPNDERMIRGILTPCPEGFVAKSTQQFQLYENFSIKTKDGLRKKAGDFCVNPVYPSADALASDEPLQYAVRFCDRDPCHNDACLRKCCPIGTAVSELDKACQPSSAEAFTKDVRQMLNVDEETTPVVSSYPVPCKADSGLSLLNATEFRIFESGQMYSNHYPCDQGYTRLYCVDHFVKGNVTTMKGMRCFPQYRIYPTVDSTDSPTMMADSVFPYLMFTSSGFLMVTFAVYAVLPEIRNTQGLIVMCHVGSMAALFTGLGVIQLQLITPIAPWGNRISSSHSVPIVFCVLFAVMVQFAFLATFSWLHVMCFDIWWTFRVLRPKRFGRRKRGFSVNSTFKMYSLFGWGFPLVIVAAGQLVQHVIDPSGRYNLLRPDFGQRNRCWFTCWKSFMAYLHGPVGILILCNVFFFLMTATHLFRSRKESSLAARNLHLSSHVQQRDSVTKQRLLLTFVFTLTCDFLLRRGNCVSFRTLQMAIRIRVIFSLFILMGVFWSMEVVSFAIGNSYTVWYIFDILNTLTGFFVFFLFVCKPKVWKLLKKKFPKLAWLNPLFVYCCRGQKERTASETTASIRTASTLSRNPFQLTASARQKQQQEDKATDDGLELPIRRDISIR